MDSAVIGIPDDEAGEVPKGFVVLRKGFDTTPDEIIAFVNGKLAGYKKIHYVDFIDAILEPIVEHRAKRDALGLRGKDDILPFVWSPLRCACRLRIRQIRGDHVQARSLSVQRVFRA